MLLSKIFLQIFNDVMLIKLKHDLKLNEKLKDSLNKIGWVEHPVKRCIVQASTSMTALSYETTEFRKGKYIEGSSEWYKDLATICAPGHQPGILTFILG